MLKLLFKSYKHCCVKLIFQKKYLNTISNKPNLNTCDKKILKSLILVLIFSTIVSISKKNKDHLSKLKDDFDKKMLFLNNLKKQLVSNQILDSQMIIDKLDYIKITNDEKSPFFFNLKLYYGLCKLNDNNNIEIKENNTIDENEFKTDCFL